MILPWAGTLDWKVYTIEADTTDGDTTIEVDPSDAELIEEGMQVTGPNIPDETVVVSVDPDTGLVEISNAPTSDESGVELEFFFRYQFEFPPSQDTDDQDNAKQAVQTSLSGIQQVQTFHIEVERNITYNMLTREQRDLLRVEFFEKWALLGFTFRYRDDETLGSFQNYQLNRFAFTNARTVKKHPAYLYSLNLNIRRVIDV